MNRAGVSRGRTVWSDRCFRTDADVEVAGGSQRLGAQELVDPGGPMRAEEGLRRLARNIVLGRLAIFGAGSARRPGGGSTSRSARAACTPGRSTQQKGITSSSSKRVTRLDRGVHRDPVPLGDHQEPGEHHLVADVERLVQRVPAGDPVVGDVQVVVGAVVARAASTSPRSRGTAWPGRSSRRCPAGRCGRRRWPARAG